MNLPFLLAHIRLVVTLQRITFTVRCYSVTVMVDTLSTHSYYG